MTVEATGRESGRKGIAASSAARRGPAAAMCGEWKACETAQPPRLEALGRGRARQAASTASASPEITVRCGAL